jgi:hypothetical protein
MPPVAREPMTAALTRDPNNPPETMHFEKVHRMSKIAKAENPRQADRSNTDP